MGITHPAQGRPGPEPLWPPGPWEAMPRSGQGFEGDPLVFRRATEQQEGGPGLASA